MGCYPEQNLGGKAMYNMKFIAKTDAASMSFVAGLELTPGVTVKYGTGGMIIAFGLSEKDRIYIEKHFRFWAA